MIKEMIFGDSESNFISSHERRHVSDIGFIHSQLRLYHIVIYFESWHFTVYKKNSFDSLCGCVSRAR